MHDIYGMFIPLGCCMEPQILVLLQAEDPEMQEYLTHKSVDDVTAQQSYRVAKYCTADFQKWQEFLSDFPEIVEMVAPAKGNSIPDEGMRSALEGIHGSHKSRPVEAWGIPLIGACFAVARIDFKSGQHNGSGFLVEAESLGFPFAGVVLVTCNHVVSDPDKFGASLRYGYTKHPDRMKVTFQLRDPDISYDCEVVWQSPVDQLDISILRLSPQPVHHRRYDFEATSLVPAFRDPELKVIGHNRRWRLSRLFALHHPGGRKLECSFEDNFFRGVKARPGTTFPMFLHYDAPTEAGSSGAPILNEDLEVVAVHRAGSETLHDGENPVKNKRGVNEGLSIQSLREAIAQSYKSAPKPKRRYSLW